ncbi:phospholipid scramblase-related protein [Nocardiopsis sp. CT-R113]|uniref:Phospholipid scramblase-related protein n=1 Tax=Nocardiopsis codii TaxID=3065942 RepID=A0ABU7K312_9ACTN|nr:phospholipid scramblase-related protein [Nocardiopsis sp. CT-R113]MEE2036628.1 phospholipid scramblase-related protein [Nocardiopsis sp. CT-R113]
MDFLAANPLLVRQPKNLLAVNSEYFCFDHTGRQVAHVRQDASDAGSRLLQQFATGSTRDTLFVGDVYGHHRLTIHKSWSWMTATTAVSLPDGRRVGTIEQDLTFFRAAFTLLDPWKRRLGTIEGDLLGRDFRINDHHGHEVARVDRRLPDLGELFTAADTYVLHHRYAGLPEPLRTLVVASGVTIDLVLREGSSGTAFL